LDGTIEGYIRYPDILELGACHSVHEEETDNSALGDDKEQDRNKMVGKKGKGAHKDRAVENPTVGFEVALHCVACT
jgi:hypothetical protein